MFCVEIACRLVVRHTCIFLFLHHAYLFDWISTRMPVQKNEIMEAFSLINLQIRIILLKLGKV